VNRVSVLPTILSVLLPIIMMIVMINNMPKPPVP
jgi:hypothetical protein